MIVGGRFRVDRMLGAGGMGVVVAATHLELGQQVALKVLHDELATNPTIVARFLREARAVAQLRTEHVCRVIDVARLDSGAPFIVMEMLDGSDLGSVVVRGPLPVVIAVEYIIQACVALAEAHAAGIVHRDLKPANLFVTRRADGGALVKVLDFGIAKAATAAEARLTHTTSTMGSPGFMSPEQIKSARDVDLRTDIWALGVTLYQLLSGRMPFGGTQLAEIAVNITTAAPAPLEVEPAVRAIVLRCLDKDPERRFPDVAALAVALLPFGGPSTPRFVREITRGQIAIPAHPAAVVPVTAPTAVSRVASSAPPAVAAAPSSVTRAPDPAPIRGGNRRWVLGVIAIVVLVGVGGLVGWLARGTAPGAAPAAVVVIDAGGASGPRPPATVVDASPSVPDGPAIDPWAERVEGADEDPEPAEPEPAPAPDAAAMKVTRDALAPHAKQMRAALRQVEPTLGRLKTQLPDQFEELVAGYTQSACMVEDAAIAQRLYDRISDPEARRQSASTCAQFGITIIDRTPAAGSGAAPRAPRKR